RGPAFSAHFRRAFSLLKLGSEHPKPLSSALPSMNLRSISAPFLVLFCAIALQNCGGGTESPSPVPTPLPTPNFPVIVAAGDISCDSATPQLPCKSKETS